MKNIRKCESLKGGQIQHKIKNQQVFTNQQKPNEEIIVDKRSQFIMQKKNENEFSKRCRIFSEEKLQNCTEGQRRKLV